MKRVLSTLFLLAIASAIPIANVLALGYAFEVEGKVARGERVEASARAPKMALAMLAAIAWMLIIRALFGAGVDAKLIDPESKASPWLFAATGLVSIAALAHLFRLIDRRMFDGTKALVKAGLAALLSALALLAAPTALLLLAHATIETRPLLAILSALAFFPVLARLPFAQAHLAAHRDQRMRDAWKHARELARRAPLAHAAALFTGYLCVLPCLLLHVVELPPVARPFTALIAIPCVAAARLVFALAYRRAAKQKERAPLALRTVARTLELAVIATHVLILMLLPAIDARGGFAIFMHPAFSLAM